MLCYRRLLIPVLVAALPVWAQGLDQATRENVGMGFRALGIGENELGFYKQWATDSFFRLAAVDLLLDEPLEVAGYVDSFAQRFLANEDKPFDLAWLQWQETDAELRPGDSAKLRQQVLAAARQALDGTDMMPPGLGQAVNVILAGFRVASGYNDKALSGLDELEVDRLLGEAPDFWTDEDDSLEPTMCGVLHREFGREYDTAQEVKAETLLRYLRKVDRKALALSGLSVLFAVQEAERLLTEEPLAFPHEMEAEFVSGREGPVLFEAETEFGLVTVGGFGNDRYERDRCLVIDLGGNDVHASRGAGGIGRLGGAFSVCIDLEGDDLYCSERAFAQGAAIMGTGVLLDRSGNDTYRAKHCSQGAGILGTGVLCDLGGRDQYSGGCFSQAAGHVGVGLLIDDQGNDVYRCFCHGQAFASTWGHGLLLEGEGNDLYYSGGEYTHDPLLPKEYRSLSQGFSIGWRPDASGGIGFLCDRSGNDFYNAEVFAQGTSYWYSLGALWDGAGYDHYSAEQYSQGAGIHLAVGCLIDNDGNDSYYSRLGPSQGEGHDLSVGVLVDRKGHDVYHASGGQGTALTNSVGLFVDLTGNDVYSSTERLALAGGRPARGFASIGSFLDAEGEDFYTGASVGSNLGAWTNGTYGAGIDLKGERVAGDEADEGDTLEPESDSLDLPIDSIFKYAATWEVGNARAKVKQARKQLSALGSEAIEWVFENKADSKDGLESRAVEQLLKDHPDIAKPYLFRALRHDKLRARANAVYWLGKLESEAEDAVDSLFLAMKQERASPRWVARALGEIGDSLVVPRILFLLEDEYEPSRIVTAEACGKLKNPVAIPELIRALDDRLFTVRSAAEAALEGIGKPVLEPVLYAMLTLRPPALGHALRAAGRVAAGLDTLQDRELRVQCRKLFLSKVGHESEFVRMTAVEALDALMDGPLRRELEAARAVETNRFVLAAFDKALSE